jgi:hypothetical protein
MLFAVCVSTPSRSNRHAVFPPANRAHPKSSPDGDKRDIHHVRRWLCRKRRHPHKSGPCSRRALRATAQCGKFLARRVTADVQRAQSRGTPASPGGSGSATVRLRFGRAATARRRARLTDCSICDGAVTSPVVIALLVPDISSYALSVQTACDLFGPETPNPTSCSSGGQLTDDAELYRVATGAGHRSQADAEAIASSTASQRSRGG